MERWKRAQRAPHGCSSDNSLPPNMIWRRRVSEPSVHRNFPVALACVHEEPFLLTLSQCRDATALPLLLVCADHSGGESPMATAGAPLRIQLLGPVRTWRNGVEVALGPPKQRAVLGLLASRAGDVVCVENVVDAGVGQCRPADGRERRAHLCGGPAPGPGARPRQTSRRRRAQQRVRRVLPAVGPGGRGRHALRPAPRRGAHVTGGDHDRGDAAAVREGPVVLAGRGAARGPRSLRRDGARPAAGPAADGRRGVGRRHAGGGTSRRAGDRTDQRGGGGAAAGALALAADRRAVPGRPAGPRPAPVRGDPGAAAQGTGHRTRRRSAPPLPADPVRPPGAALARRGRRTRSARGPGRQAPGRAQTGPTPFAGTRVRGPDQGAGVAGRRGER